MQVNVRHRFASIATLASLTAALLLAEPSPVLAAPDPSSEQTLVEQINRERTAHGLPALTLRSDLTHVARAHSVEMADQGRLHHNDALGSDVANWRRLSENVGVGATTGSLHRAFMDSPGHRANVLDAKVTEVGLGVELRGSTMWVTEVFRLPMHATDAPARDRTPVPSGRDSVPLSGDWNGDGSVTPGWFVDGVFHLSDRHDGGGPLRSFRYGVAGDIPLVGDWDGNGTDTAGIVRDGEWHLINHHRGGHAQITFVYGRVLRGDVPLAGDWDGDGRDTPAIVRDGEWHFINELRGGPADFSFVYGRILRGDIPLVGDWNRDGIDTAGIIRDGEWHLVNRHRGGVADQSFVFGRVSRGDVPVVGDWDGDRITEVAVVRDGTWHYRFTNAGGRADLSHTWRL